MKTMIFYAVFGAGALAVLFGTLHAFQHRTRLWPLTILGGLTIIFCGLFWLWPAIDQGWQKIQIEQLRIDLRETRAQLTTSLETNAELRESVRKVRRDLDSANTALDTHGAKLRTVIERFRYTRSILIQQGIRAPAYKKEPLTFGLSTGELIKIVEADIDSLSLIAPDTSQLSRLSQRLNAAVQKLVQEFPDHTPKIDSKFFVGLSPDRPADSISRLIGTLEKMRRLDLFSRRILLEIDAAMTALRSNGDGLVVEKLPTSNTQFTLDETARRELVYKTIRSLTKIRVSPELTRKLHDQVLLAKRSMQRSDETTSKSNGPDKEPLPFAAVATDAQEVFRQFALGSDLITLQQLINQLQAQHQKFRPTSANPIVQDPTKEADARSPREQILSDSKGILNRLLEDYHRGIEQEIPRSLEGIMIDRRHANNLFACEAAPAQGNITAVPGRIVTNVEGRQELHSLSFTNSVGNQVLTFEEALFSLEAGVGDIANAIKTYSQRLSKGGADPTLKLRLYLRGSADHKGTKRTITPYSHVPPHLRSGRIRTDMLAPESEYPFILEPPRATAITNDLLPNLRALWLRQNLLRHLKNIEIVVVEGDLVYGNHPLRRTVDVTIALISKQRTENRN